MFIRSSPVFTLAVGQNPARDPAFARPREARGRRFWIFASPATPVATSIGASPQSWPRDGASLPTRTMRAVLAPVLASTWTKRQAAPFLHVPGRAGEDLSVERK
eukprot:scaffold125246_cov69-Phaeocystis_antarctica.AAC.2